MNFLGQDFRKLSYRLLHTVKQIRLKLWPYSRSRGWWR